MPQLVNFRTLIESADRSSKFWAATPSIESQPFAVETGFHIYGELNLALKLAAATDTQDAKKLLSLLQEYVAIAEVCANIIGADLLEVQGERIHLLFPAKEITKDTVKSLLRFCVAFASTVYTRLKKSGGDSFQGFKMAADHGRAVLLISGSQANASVISLGTCANIPAKQLRAATAGALRIRTDQYKLFSEASASTDWINITVKNGEAISVPVDANDLIENFSMESEREIAGKYTDLNVRFADRTAMKELLNTQISEAIKTQGFGFRADLDGFCKQVAAAKTDAEIMALVIRFSRIMAYPDSFAARLGNPIIKLPWAGDCANLIILPNGSDYEDAREFLPVKAASEWHSQMAGHDHNRMAWFDHVKGAKWSVGVAGGGDDSQGSNGQILVAPLKGKRRDFLVAAGWGVGRSLDAQEADGVLGGDTVLHEIDHKALAPTHKTAFSELKGSSIFWVARNLTKETIRDGGASILTPKTSIPIPGLHNISVGTPKPWFNDEQRI